MPTKSSGAGPSAGDLTNLIKPKRARKKAPTRQGQATPLDLQVRVWAHIIERPEDSDSYIAEALGMNAKTVNRIRKKMPPELSSLVLKKMPNVAHRVATFIENSLDSLDRINEITKDEDWLRQQNASELATFYGVKSDKVIRLLEAAQRAHQPQLVEATEGA